MSFWGTISLDSALPFQSHGNRQTHHVPSNRSSFEGLVGAFARSLRDFQNGFQRVTNSGTALTGLSERDGASNSPEQNTTLPVTKLPAPITVTPLSGGPGSRRLQPVPGYGMLVTGEVVNGPVQVVGYVNLPDSAVLN